MSKSIFVCPQGELKVFDPETKDFLPKEGREVASSVYWKRRLADGDIVIKTPAKTPVKSSK